MTRRQAREEAFKLLYQMDIHKDEKDEVLESFLAENEIEPHHAEYIKEVVKGTTHHKEQLDKLIEENAVGWKINRISKVNMAILRLAAYEMIHRKDIPDSVSINEAVELTKNYDSNESASFVNGVLGSIQKKLQIDN
ncbi:transcription antitermination factor NusB [Petroclostridium sp. X23]|uniref:transcription antitermination factor NusB n=1 Tax=Petroclostridium sp. X23 TaxID=3045146 RepID=UPI0024AD24F3|nr:transcription antitermination factor NusB [Petroclostridium sp. X23]WHH59638.1 transcription antitermination factor NusB [Petroclostridium sp. X23]